MEMQLCEWKNSPKNMNNKLHTICSYMAMFPPSLPYYFIQKYSREGDIVLDPFAGRGTTPLEACLNNRVGIGVDKNPLAYLLTRSKVNVPKKTKIERRIDELEGDYGSKKFSLDDIDWKIKMLYSNYTLKQLLYLREELEWKKDNADAFIAAMIVGIMHGKTEGYLSISMPNTFSMSPNYVKRFIKKYKLKKPKRNVFELLRKKLERCYQKPKIKGKAYCLDARNLSRINDKEIDLVITSPPYTRVITYGKYNWIRLWFLKEDSLDVEKRLFTTQSLNKYTIFMEDCLNEIKRVTKSGGTIILVIGDVLDRDGHFYNLAEMIWEKCAEPLEFLKLHSIISDEINDGSNVSRIWNDKRIQPKKIDRILVLKNP